MRYLNRSLVIFILIVACLTLATGLYARDFVRTLKSPSAFSGIVVNDAFKVNIHKGKIFEAKVYGTEADLKKVMMRVVGNNLEIRRIHTPMIGIRFEGVPRVEVTLPELKSVTMNGSGVISSSDHFEGAKLSLVIAGSGNISLSSVNYHQIIDVISGSGSTMLSGMTSKLEVTLVGSGIFNGEKLKSIDAEITITGSGEVRPNVSGILNATISGSGSIYYLGKPTVNRVITGSGDVTSLK